MYHTILSKLPRRQMGKEVLTRLKALLLELQELISKEEEVLLVEPFINKLRWLKIDLEFIHLTAREDSYEEHWIVDARQTVYDVGQFIKRMVTHTIQNKLDFMKDVLSSYDKTVNTHDETVLYDIRALTYHAFEVDRPQGGDSILKELSVWDRFVSEKLVHQEDHQQGSSSTTSGVRDAAVTNIKAQDFVGLEEQVNFLVGHLVNEDTRSGYNVVSICGMGGLGKTTIAKCIYNHPVVRGHFSRFYWASMSSSEEKDWDILYRIVADLLPIDKFQSCLAIDKVEKKVEALEFLLGEELKLKKWLIVFDDVCSTNILGILKVIMSMETDVKSRIVVTCRNKQEAFHRSTKCLIYVPRFLNEDESWELLTQKASIGGHTRDLMNLLPKNPWMRLIRRCGGLPLALVEVGEYKLMGTAGHMHAVIENGRDKMLPPRLFELFPLKERVLKVLATSYDELPQELKLCFLYLRNIPPDSEIEINKLYQLWIAENMITTENIPSGVTMLDVGYHYLEILVRKNLVQLQVDEFTGQLKSCRLHTLLRELCFSEVKDDNLQVMDLRAEQVDKEVTRSFSTPIRIINLVVYLSDPNDVDNYHPPKREVARDLHSVLFLTAMFLPRSKVSRNVESHLSDFKMVRVLDLGGLVFSKLGKSIGKLKHLKYLGLRHAVFHELPTTIANMKDLQTLDLWGNENTQHAFTSIPDVLWKLSSLKYLYLRNIVPLSRAQKGRKMQLGRLLNLETLENFDSRVFNVRDLQSLKNLRKLGATICNILDLEMVINHVVHPHWPFLSYVAISIKHCDLYSEEGQSLLQKLLCFRLLSELSIDGRTGRLPSYNDRFSKSLMTVTLESCELIDDPMETLENLPNLRGLFLKWNAYVGVKMVCSAIGFPQLRVLQMHRIRNIHKWTLEEGGMPNLSTLEISSCPNLEKIPHGLQFITTLKKLEVVWMPEEFCNRFQWEDGRQGDDFFKVQHVSSIKITDIDGTKKEYQKADAAKKIGVYMSGGISSSPSVEKATESFNLDSDEHLSGDDIEGLLQILLNKRADD